MSEAGKAVFLSYASQDAAAARCICEALRAAGVEVWFDQSDLRGGDAWDAKIRRQIRECALFVPIISANTQARSEGYFRLEWHLAEQRSHLIARGRPFIVPVAIDETRGSDALVPDAFLAVQWMRLPGGTVTPAFAERVAALLRGPAVEVEVARDARAAADESGRKAPPTVKSRRVRWIAAVTTAVVLAVGAAVFVFRPRAAKPGLPLAAPAAPLSEARQLIERAQAILDREALTREQLDTAGELCDRALQLDPTDALVWSAAARVDLLLIHPYGYDGSAERRKRAQSRALRAYAIAPELFEVRATHAAVMAYAGGTPPLLAEAESIFRGLLVSRPDDKTLVRQLADVLREQKRFEEAAVLFESIGDFEVAGWSYFEGGLPGPALIAADRALREKRTVTGLQLKTVAHLNGEQDLTAAQAALDQLRPSELATEISAGIAMKVALYRRDAERIMQIMQGLPADYLQSRAFNAPRQFFTGVAHEISGRAGGAEREWRAGLALVEERMKLAPDDRELIVWAAWLHAALGGNAEAERLLARAQDVASLDRVAVDALNAKVFLRLQRHDLVLDWLRETLRAKSPRWIELHAEARFSPAYDPLRGDPRFEGLLRETLPEGAKPME